MTQQRIFPIVPGLFCVPSALVALTGADFASVIFPALNRAARADTLTGAVAGAFIRDTLTVLDEMGYDCRRAKAKERRKVMSWAKLSADRNYPYPLLLHVRSHVVVAFQGKVFDNHMPHGPIGHDHPFAHSIVMDAYLVQPRKV
jgi:hypothetical protein